MENPNTQPGQENRETEKKATDTYLFNGPPSRRGRYTVIGLIVLLIVAALFVRGRFLRIHDVEVPGLTRYSEAEVAARAGITAGSTYFNLNENRIRANIEKDRYLRFDGMEKVWPDKVILYVQERSETFNLLNMGVQYILSADGMVLANSNRMALDNGCVNVTGMSVRDIRVGAPVVCDDSEQMEVLLQLYEELIAQGALGEIAELNMTSLDSIYLVTLDGYTANIGDRTELRAKIGTVRAVVRALREAGDKGGMIEATSPGQATYRPVQQ